MTCLENLRFKVTKYGDETIKKAKTLLLADQTKAEGKVHFSRNHLARHDNLPRDRSTRSR